MQRLITIGVAAATAPILQGPVPPSTRSLLYIYNGGPVTGKALVIRQDQLTTGHTFKLNVDRR